MMNLFLLLLLLTAAPCNAFTSSSSIVPSARRKSIHNSLLKSSSVDKQLQDNDNYSIDDVVDDDDNVECFIVNYDMVEEEGETPEVVCTSKPDEFAWFNGLDKDNIKKNPNNIIKDEAYKECIEGSSPNGVPEWECTVNDDDWRKTP